MDIIPTIARLRSRLASAGRIAFVPTMGNLHDGHLALAQLARQHGDTVVVSIFVNPLQFGANEDLASYPRTLAADCEKLAAAGVDLVFTPSDAELYPAPQTIQMEPPPIANELCGAHRPGHFKGVCTVVAKLFNIVQPEVAVFGKKDYQQLFILREMVRQLNFPVAIVAAETMREESGLAMSSRNGYLKPHQLVEAPRLYRTLQQVVQTVHSGRRDFDAIQGQARQYLTTLGWVVDYIEVRSATTLLPPAPDEKQLVALGAARLGSTRLIDNIEFAL
jgi:pantoate--beta-alanine ligase